MLSLGLFHDSADLIIMVAERLLYLFQFSEGDVLQFIHHEAELFGDLDDLTLNVLFLVVHVLLEESEMALFAMVDLLEGSHLVFNCLHVFVELVNEAVQGEDVRLVLSGVV